MWQNLTLLTWVSLEVEIWAGFLGVGWVLHCVWAGNSQWDLATLIRARLPPPPGDHGQHSFSKKDIRALKGATLHIINAHMLPCMIQLWHGEVFESAKATSQEDLKGDTSREPSLPVFFYSGCRGRLQTFPPLASLGFTFHPVSQRKGQVQARNIKLDPDREVTTV